jgi:hypothetical protein
MNQQTYYLIFSMGLVLIVGGFLCVGLTMYKSGDMPIAAPSATIDILESRKKICYVTGGLMILIGSVCMATLVYYSKGENVILRG